MWQAKSPQGVALTMADPQSLDASTLHPCHACNGRRALTWYTWRTPAYEARCVHCGYAVVAETPKAAVREWNQKNPFRVLDKDTELVAPSTTPLVQELVR